MSALDELAEHVESAGDLNVTITPHGSAWVLAIGTDDGPLHVAWGVSIERAARNLLRGIRINEEDAA